MGHHNLGIKTPSKAQNTIKQSGLEQPPRRILKAKTSRLPPIRRGRRTTRRPNPLQDPKRPNMHSAHGPTLKYDPSEASPSRLLIARCNSASPEGRRPTLGEPTDSASFEAPSTEPPAGPRLGGKLRLARGYPWTDGTATHLLTHPTDKCI